MWMSNDCLSILEANDDLIILKRHQQTRETIEMTYTRPRKGLSLNFKFPNASICHHLIFYSKRTPSIRMTWCRYFLILFECIMRQDMTNYYTKLHYHSSFVQHMRDKNKIEQIKTQVFYTSWRNEKQIPLRQSNLFIYHSTLNKFWFYWSSLYWVNIDKFTFEMKWQLKKSLISSLRI